MCPVERTLLEKSGVNVGMDVENRTNLKDMVIELLYLNPNKGYSQREVSVHINRSEQHSRQILMKLVQDGIVDRIDMRTRGRGQCSKFYMISRKYIESHQNKKQ